MSMSIPNNITFLLLHLLIRKLKGKIWTFYHKESIALFWHDPLEIWRRSARRAQVLNQKSGGVPLRGTAPYQ